MAPFPFLQALFSFLSVFILIEYAQSIMTNIEGHPANAKRLLWAGFMAILAAGVGFAIRGGILDNWGAQFGFNQAELGRISAQGLTGFCFGVIIGGVIADKIGYGKLVVAAFLFHIISAVVTLLPGEGTSKEVAYNMLFWGSFIFALANGDVGSCRQSVGCDVVSQQPHALFKYPSCELACWSCLGLLYWMGP